MNDKKMVYKPEIGKYYLFEPHNNLWGFKSTNIFIGKAISIDDDNITIHDGYSPTQTLLSKITLYHLDP